MLAVARLFAMALMFIYILILTLVISVFRPFHRNNVQIVANTLGKLGNKIMGITIESRVPDSVRNGGPYVFIANHQNSYDIFTMASVVLPGTVSIGKQSLKWIPVFGQIYWLSGNIMIDRKNSGKARGTLGQAISKVKDKGISIWLFPEGTRSNGKGLLPFKTGAFHAAVQADVPMVMICGSNSCGQIKLNKWNNGKMIIEMLPPHMLTDTEKQNIRSTSVKMREQMGAKIELLNQEMKAENAK